MQEIINTINKMNGIDFESFGHIILEVKLKMLLHHPGQKPNGHPLKCTVDTYSDDGKIVGEYSVEEKYFSDKTKPQKDIEHAIKKHPQVEKLFLFSNRIPTPTEGTNFVNWITNQEKAYNIKIYWFDAKKIAEFIICAFKNNPFNLQKIKKYISSSSYEMLLNKMDEFSIQLPENYYGDYKPAYDQLINKNILLISGASGIGKSTLARKLIKELAKNKYVDYFYYSDRIDENLMLFNSSGININLNTILQKEKVLIFLDGIETIPAIFLPSIENLIENNYIIITSEYTNDDFKESDYLYESTFPSDEQAENILNYKLAEKKCTNPIVLKRIFEKTSKHPLTLEIIRKCIKQNSDITWDEIADSIMDLEDDNHKLIASRLIEKHIINLKCNEIEALKWLGVNRISYDVLKKLIKAINIDKLIKRSLIKKSGNIIILHNVILEAINKINISISDKLSNDFKNSFYELLEQKHFEKDSAYYIILYLHRDNINELYYSNLNFYKALFFFICSNKTHYFENIKNISIAQLYSDVLKQKDRDEYALKSIIEYWEAILIHCIDAEYKSNCEKAISQLTELIQVFSKSDSSLTTLYHHLGKFYLKSDQLDNADKCFNQVIQNSPCNYETHLQIARIRNKQRKIQEVNDIISMILNTYIQNKPISISVVLSAYEDLKKCDKDTKKIYLIDNYDYFKTAFSSIIIEDYERPYRILANIGNVFTYEHPEKYLELCEMLHELDISNVELKEHFNIAQIYKNAGKASERLTGNSKDYYNKAEKFYESSYCNNKIKSAFQLTQRMENLQLLSKNQDLIILFLKHDELKKDYFANYRVGKSYFLINEYNEAEKYLFIAKDYAESDTKLSNYISSLYHIIAKNYIAKNESVDIVTQYYEKSLQCEEKNSTYWNEIKEEYDKYLEEQNKNGI